MNDFSFQGFAEYVKPVLWTISGIGLFIGIVSTAFGIMTTKGKSEERENFFSNMIWVIIGAFLLSAASGITLLFFK